MAELYTVHVVRTDYLTSRMVCKGNRRARIQFMAYEKRENGPAISACYMVFPTINNWLVMIRLRMSLTLMLLTAIFPNTKNAKRKTE